MARADRCGRVRVKENIAIPQYEVMYLLVAGFGGWGLGRVQLGGGQAVRATERVP